MFVRAGDPGFSRRKLLQGGALLAAAGVAAACATQARGEQAEPGTVAWRYPVEGQMLAGLRVVGGVVLVQTLDSLSGLEASSGKRLWQVPITIAPSGIDYYGGLGDGTLYVCGGDPPYSNERVLGVDIATGQRNWSFEPPEDAVLNGVFGERDGAVLLTVLNQTTRRREAMAVDRATNAVRWRAECPGDNTRLHLPAAGPLVYSAYNNGDNLLALDAATGATVWSRAGDVDIQHSAVALGPLGGVILGTDFGHVFGLDPATGATMWKTRNLGFAIYEIFAVEDAFFACDGSAVHAWRTGMEATSLWNLAVSDKREALDASFRASAGVLYLLAAGAVRAIDAGTGNLRWIHTDPGFDNGQNLRFAVGDTHCYVESDSTTTNPAVVALVC
ncbi:PQQ-binding-like beta-propeller repeat protein [Nocardia brasiliensis]|uniref:outer membrane protein assembly factor BamB family protein n=1 Tax=Nocardia brasiliensis TaxID=37326 RepID=UPI00366B248D